MASSKVTNGKCLCGTVQIKAEGDFKACVACSCKNCQICSGSAYTVNLAYAKDNITVTKGLEDLKAYEGVYSCSHPSSHTNSLHHDERLRDFPLSVLSPLHIQTPHHQKGRTQTHRHDTDMS